MHIIGGTDVGSVRSVNEDYYKIFKFSDVCFCAVVADGMGGHKGGKVASTTAATYIVDYIRENIHSAENSEESMYDILRNAVNGANEQVYIKSLSDDELSGMGTTAVTVIYNDGTVYIANVGDSRLYLINNGIRQITRDHSLVQDMIDQGLISQDEANEHPNKNIITRAVGTEKDVKIDLYKLEVEPEYKLLMCTDGLTNFVDDATIEKTARRYSSSVVKDKLIDLANKNGGRDNITLIYIDFDEVSR